jgi:hypothetical protein
MNKAMNLLAGWTLESSRKIYSNKYIELYEDVLDIKNKKKIYTRARRKDYSTIVPFVSDNEILVIKSYRLWSIHIKLKPLLVILSQARYHYRQP